MPEVNMRATPDGAGFIHNDWELEFKTGKPGDNLATVQLSKKDGSRTLPILEYGKLKTLNIPDNQQPGSFIWKSASRAAGTTAFRQPTQQAPVDFMTADAIRAMVESENKRKLMTWGGGLLAVLAVLVVGWLVVKKVSG